jgi:nitroimidazol reductase NimA-like FMN-containing flavoprotein (pyridoxamine 5'-phosphate oxidase superfamily)
MAYGVTDDTMYLHGALANSLLRAGANTDVCVTVTLLDGLVLAKTPFNHTMNYRSVVVRGTARVVDNADEHLAALRAVSDHIVPNWDSSRPPTAEELRATRVVAVPLSEMSAKVRVGMPTNDEADTDGNHWCGVIPLVSHWGEPSTAPDAGATVPRSIARFAGTEVSPPRE